jgi:hypothetical protein
MTGYHTRWVRPEEAADDPERIEEGGHPGRGSALRNQGYIINRKMQIFGDSAARAPKRP